MDPEEISPLPPSDPLVQLGLVDPATGRALVTSDPDPTPTPAARVPPSGAADGGAGAGGPTEGGGGGDPARQAREFLERRAYDLASQAPAAVAQYTAAGFHPAVAQALVSAIHDRELTQARLEAERMVTLPFAREKLARDLAAEHSTGNVKIAPTELLDQQTLEGMRAKAAALAQVRRDAAFQQRRADGRDGVEGGPPAGKLAAALDDLSPTSLIKLGLLAGDLS